MHFNKFKSRDQGVMHMHLSSVVLSLPCLTVRVTVIFGLKEVRHPSPLTVTASEAGRDEIALVQLGCGVDADSEVTSAGRRGRWRGGGGGTAAASRPGRLAPADCDPVPGPYMGGRRG